MPIQQWVNQLNSPIGWVQECVEGFTIVPSSRQLVLMSPGRLLSESCACSPIARYGALRGGGRCWTPPTTT